MNHEDTCLTAWAVLTWISIMTDASTAATKQHAGMRRRGEMDYQRKVCPRCQSWTLKLDIETMHWSCQNEGCGLCL